MNINHEFEVPLREANEEANRAFQSLSPQQQHVLEPYLALVKAAVYGNRPVEEIIDLIQNPPEDLKEALRALGEAP